MHDTNSYIKLFPIFLAMIFIDIVINNNNCTIKALRIIHYLVKILYNR